MGSLPREKSMKGDCKEEEDILMNIRVASWEGIRKRDQDKVMRRAAVG